MSEGAGLYVHVPFCSAICPYCDFAVRTAAAPVRARYVEALLAEVSLWEHWETQFDTIYFGGGTPSLLAGDALGEILNTLRASLPFSDGTRLFFEANPEDVTDESTALWRDLGVDFLSLGVQSFDNRELKFLGRRHTGDAAVKAVEICLDSGIETVSLDIMFGLPGQEIDALTRTLRTVTALGPQHVSCYQLTVHEGTAFGRRRERGRLVELPDDAQADRFELVHRSLAGGWQAYEVSNFAVDAVHRSSHNQKYWRHAPYLGLGPSAHSFDGQKRRWWNVRKLDDYVARIESGVVPIAGDETLSPEQLALEALMLGLRTCEGVSLSGFERRYGIDLMHDNRRLVDRLVADGLMMAGADHLALTRAGLAVTDWVAAQFDVGN